MSAMPSGEWLQPSEGNGYLVSRRCRPTRRQAAPCCFICGFDGARHPKFIAAACGNARGGELNEDQETSLCLGSVPVVRLVAERLGPVARERRHGQRYGHRP